MSRIRSFIALPTPDHALERITGLIQEFQSVSSDVKWEHPEKLHITLKFLGSQEESDVRLLIRLLEEKLRGVPPFEFGYEGVGVFPQWDQPRVFWVGTSHSDSIFEVHRRVEEAAAVCSIERDDRPFHPHVTIGRVKSSRGVTLLTARVKSVTFEPVMTRCNEVLVMKSDLLPAGSRYTVLSRIPLIQ